MSGPRVQPRRFTVTQEAARQWKSARCFRCGQLGHMKVNRRTRESCNRPHLFASEPEAAPAPRPQPLPSIQPQRSYARALEGPRQDRIENPGKFCDCGCQKKVEKLESKLEELKSELKAQDQRFSAAIQAIKQQSDSKKEALNIRLDNKASEPTTRDESAPSTA